MNPILLVMFVCIAIVIAFCICILIKSNEHFIEKLETTELNISDVPNISGISAMANNSKPILWMYWENKPGVSKPPYINLCFKTVKKYCNGDFNIILLDNKSVFTYLPNLRRDINELIIAQKTDYIRVALLYKYGGIWLDADTIVMKPLGEIVDKINDGHDYIGFGCSYEKCFNGFPKPSNGTMASKKNGILMGRVLADLNKKLDERNNGDFGYFDLGKISLWKNIHELMNDDNYSYYHYPSKYDGSRDANGKWVNVDNHISTSKTELIDENELLFVFLENNKFMGNNKKYNWFSKLTEIEILNGDYWISYLFRKSLS